MEINRFTEMCNQIRNVEKELTPKTEAQLVMEQREAEVEAEIREDAIEAGLDPDNPLFDPAELERL